MEYFVSWKREVLNLLKIAIGCLKEAGIPDNEWTFGGGSALMFYYWHRESKDIDILITDPQYLTMLSPRLNNYAESIAIYYEEASNFVKISAGDREIDFIVAPNLSGIAPVREKLNPDIEIFVEQPEEILAKKFFYRTESLKIRDFLDAYVVLKDLEKTERVKAVFKELLKGKEQILKNRAAFLQEAMMNKGILNILKELSVSPALIKEIPGDFIRIVATEIFGFEKPEVERNPGR
ncbi:nucleotidyl transferase AbiEii/AbiGii toxin family protein [Desulfurobacterium atlanticum]|uniref:Nucleotidyl transferase AbiEii toxin, Type IV TA system n=1 Tax=Desulfurobacterium atlanticum TaxID=240169 RepID=A0A239AE39_9BACT|nr:nucleotidyl transferase AbiEii/AbiGii toxin family protein [Desulfurobacterium atlanticum]SNR93865.1 Nucleotidyl transferase AbiEii toxin, Type IV TA system [Desulfurobacterium atlanticum]